MLYMADDAIRIGFRLFKIIKEKTKKANDPVIRGKNKIKEVAEQRTELPLHYLQESAKIASNFGLREAALPYISVKGGIQNFRTSSISSMEEVERKMMADLLKSYNDSFIRKPIEKGIIMGNFTVIRDMEQEGHNNAFMLILQKMVMYEEEEPEYKDRIIQIGVLELGNQSFLRATYRNGSVEFFNLNNYFSFKIENE